MKRWLIAALCLLLLCPAAALSEAHTVPTPPPPSLQNFTSVTLDGEAVDQTLWAEADLTLVNVWATYCQPCLSEMPDLGALAAEYADSGVQFVGVVSDAFTPELEIDEAQAELAAQIVEATGAAYTHLLPTESLIYAALTNVAAVPTTFFVDAQGNRVGETYLGAKDAQAWREIIQETLALLPNP